MTWRELVYMVLDALKIHSDDSKFTEEHVVFLLTKYRAYAINQKYLKSMEGVNNSNFQVLTLNIDSITNNYLCGNGNYAKSITEVPGIIKVSLPEVKLEDFSNREIVFTNNNRMKYVGYNRFLPSIIYCSIGSDKHLYLKGTNTINDITSVKMEAVFEDPNIVDDLNGNKLDILDRTFPTEAILIPSILELVIKDLTGGIYKPSDNTNDAQDALSDLAGYLRRNMKSQFQKQIDD